MTLFETVGKENTAAVAAIAMAKAKELNCPIVLSSSTGFSAKAVLSAAAEADYAGKIVVVRTTSNASLKGANKMAPEVKQSLVERGCVVVTAAHALSAGERGLSSKSHGAYPLEIMASTLYMFGQGTKVCVECTTMAMDAGELEFASPVVSLAGTSVGLDTAMVMTPAYSSCILDTRVHEILCKPTL